MEKSCNNCKHLHAGDTAIGNKEFSPPCDTCVNSFCGMQIIPTNWEACTDTTSPTHEDHT